LFFSLFYCYLLIDFYLAPERLGRRQPAAKASDRAYDSFGCCLTGVQPWVGVLLLEEEHLRSLHRWECAKLTDRNSQVQSVHLSCSNRRDCLGFRGRCDLGKLAHYRDRGRFLGSLIWTAEQWPSGC